MFAVNLLQMALAHLYAITFKMTMLARQTPTNCQNLQKHSENIDVLYGLFHLQKNPTGLYESEYFSSGSMSLLNEAIKLVLKRLRPQILPLAEVVPHPDHGLMSAIGNSYGDIYETHLEWAMGSRLNDGKGSIPDGYMEYIMPIL